MTGIKRRTFIKAGGLGVAAAVPLATAAPAVGVPHSPTVLARGLVIPWSLTFLPDGNALTGERDNRVVYRISRTGGAKVKVGTIGKAGWKLFGLALSPTYATDTLLYAHVRTLTDARVLKMTYTASAGLGAPQVVFKGIPLGTDHHGGGLVFRPDGAYLYVSVGDKGMRDQVQNRSSLVGKILRIRPDGSVPADNPWGNAAFARGFRNPEGMNFDLNGRLWAVEFGEDTTDELNRIVKGQNYGWPNYEGGDGAGPVADPVATWSPTSVCSPAGVAVRGGYAYVGALMGHCIYRVTLSTPSQKEAYFKETYGRIRWVQAAPDGSIWFTTGNNDPMFPHVAADDRVVRFLP